MTPALADGTPGISARGALSDAIRYWEPRRLLYNAVLALVVLAVYLSHLPEARATLVPNAVLMLFALAVLANVAYCACYVVDIVTQLSAYRSVWLRTRWMLLGIGTAFAGVLAYFFALGFFAEAMPPL